MRSARIFIWIVVAVFVVCALFLALGGRVDMDGGRVDQVKTSQ